MSVTFEIQKFILEKYISEYKDFLTNHFYHYAIDEPDIDMLNNFKMKAQEQLADTNQKSIEDCMRFITTSGWECIFKADNIIDTGKTLDEQSRILSDTIFSLNTNYKLDNKYFPSEIVDTINTKFLCDTYKIFVLKALLVSEYNLCNPNIGFIDALCERTRIMYYSGLLVADLDKVEDIIDMLNKKHPKTYIPKTLINLMALPFIKDYVKVDQVSSIDTLYVAAFLAIICAPSDDYMDIEEDLENNKINGITQAIKNNIEPKAVLATTIKFLEKTQVDQKFEESKKWALHIMMFLYTDTNKCLEFCKSISPIFFETIFQRKNQLK